MRARPFARQLFDGAAALKTVSRQEPRVVVRHGRDGKEEAVQAVKVRSDVGDRPFIVLEVPPQYPTEDAYLSACRALHWRTAQLRAHGFEPCTLPADASHYPPEDYDFGAGEPESAA